MYKFFVHILILCTNILKYCAYLDFLHKSRDNLFMTKLPFNFNFDDVEILKALNNANHKLGQLNGAINLLPNPYVIFNAITLGEAKESSEIENIVTTFDEIFKEMTYSKSNSASKEVLNYRQAMLTGFNLLKENGFISKNHIIQIHHIVESEVGDLRKLPGTVIMNTKTGEVLHTPPQNQEEIEEYLSNLEKYINIPELQDIDPILKMAVIHFQFESIHPFYDGNGRTGRILNVLYLVLNNLLDSPILYLINYINNNKDEYYKLFTKFRENNNYEDWIIYILKGIEETSKKTIIGKVVILVFVATLLAVLSRIEALNSYMLILALGILLISSAFMRNFSSEYEYLLNDDDFFIDRIYGVSKHKELFSFSLSDISEISENSFSESGDNIRDFTSPLSEFSPTFIKLRDGSCVVLSLSDELKRGLPGSESI